MFLSNLEKIFFLSFRTFCREGKIWKSLGAKSSEYGGWGKMDQPKYDIISCVALRYHGEVQVFTIDECRTIF